MSESPYQQLVSIAHRYLDAIAAHDPASVPFDSDCRFTENCAESDRSPGIWQTASAITYRQVFADAEAGQVGAFAVIDESGVPVIFAVRLRVAEGRITEVESIVVRDRQASIFNPAALQSPNPVWDERATEVLSREELASAANAYFQALQDDSTANVHFDPDCQRIENGFQTTSTPRTGNLNIREQIDRKTFVYIRAVGERRFPLIDRERGLVLGLAFLEVPGDVTSVTVDGVTRELPEFMRTPRSTLLFELFKVGAGGELRWIEAMMMNRPYGTKSGWA